MKYLLFLLFPLSLFSQTKAVPIVSVINNTATLSVTGSTGVQAFNWSVTPSVSFTNGVYYGGSDLNTKVTATLKPSTKYVFTLTVYDKYGGQNSASLTYDPTVVVVKPPAIDTIQTVDVYVKGALLVKVIVFSDGSVISKKQ